MRAQAGMTTVADASGGTAFLPDGEKDLEAVFRQVAAELRGQYLIQYYANADVPTGQFRRIQVDSSHAAAVTCARSPGFLREERKIESQIADLDCRLQIKNS